MTAASHKKSPWRPVRRTLVTLALAAAPLLATAQTTAAQAPGTPAAVAELSSIPAPVIAARAWISIDVTSGQVLAGSQPDMRVEPASLTKVMTAYLAFAALDEKRVTADQQVAVSQHAWKTGGSRMFIEPRKPVTFNELLQGMIVQSGNDATMALAEGVGGTAENFVRLMNEQAKALGMTGTSYRNPEGLTEPGHLTTARDLSILAMRLMRDFPQYMHYYATKEYRYEGTPASNSKNRNLLLFRDPSVDGLKTGHTNAAGYCLVATAQRDMPNVGARRLLSIVLGASSENARANESQKLLNWGYTAYDAVKLFEAGQVMEEAPVWKGSQSTVKLGREAATVVTVPSGSSGKLVTRIERQEPLVAPVAKGQQVGTLHVLLGQDTVAQLPVFAQEEVAEGGFLRRLWDAIRLWLR